MALLLFVAEEFFLDGMSTAMFSLAFDDPTFVGLDLTFVHSMIASIV